MRLCSFFTFKALVYGMDDVFMPRDDPVDASDEEMNETDRELEDFKRFCLIWFDLSVFQDASATVGYR